MSVEKSIKVWKEGIRSFDMTLKTPKPLLRIELGNEHIPDIRKQDNVLHFEKQNNKHITQKQ